MKTSELIAALQAELERHGDLEVLVYNDGDVGWFEVTGVSRDEDNDLILDFGGDRLVGPEDEDRTGRDDDLNRAD